MPTESLLHPGSRTVVHILAGGYFLLALLGLVSTWYFNLTFFGSQSGLTYLEAWFVNPSSSSAAVDVIVSAVAANIFIIREGARLGWGKWAWLAIPLTCLVALAFALPLFLGLRELRLTRAAPPATRE